MNKESENIIVLTNFLKNKYDFDDVMFIYNNTFSFYMSNIIFHGFQINVEKFKKWNDLIKTNKDTDEKIAKYLIEVIRVKLPSLKDQLIIINKKNINILEERI